MRLHAFQIAYLGNAIAPDGDVGAHALVSTSVHENAAFDEEIAAGLIRVDGGHGRASMSDWGWEL
jgi:hypothetical protein